MKCPKCGNVYSGDDAFCLIDGNLLVNDDAEQETVVNRNIPFTPPGIVACSFCGLNNKATSKFCKKCGAVFPNAGARPDNQTFGETEVFAPPVFTPPAQQVAAGPSANKNVLIGILAGLSILLLMVVVYMMGGGGIVKTDGDLATRANNPVNENSNSSSGANTPVEANKEAARKTAKAAQNSNAAFVDENLNVPPQPEVPSLPHRFERQYRGRSNVPLTLSLTKNGSSLSGTAVTPGDMDYLSGTIAHDGSFDMAGDNQGNGVTGRWRGRIRPDGTISGTWTANNGRRVNYYAR